MFYSNPTEQDGTRREAADVASAIKIHRDGKKMQIWGSRLESEMVSQVKSWFVEPQKKEGCSYPEGLKRSNSL